ncbi:hypothetical protein [Sorangium sp. So ce117]|uniref:hypothetical protein n=1 Tax=Sorangium sp. So ce117 TaxID=3133277 RepID=UPI003F633BCD
MTIDLGLHFLLRIKRTRDDHLHEAFGARRLSGIEQAGNARVIPQEVPEPRPGERITPKLLQEAEVRVDRARGEPILRHPKIGRAQRLLGRVRDLSERLCGSAPRREGGEHQDERGEDSSKAHVGAPAQDLCQPASRISLRSFAPISSMTVAS